jgi:hypothetical protein
LQSLTAAYIFEEEVYLSCLILLQLLIFSEIIIGWVLVDKLYVGSVLLK